MTFTTNINDLKNAPMGFKAYIFLDSGNVVPGVSCNYLVISVRHPSYGIQQFFGTSNTSTWGVLRWRRVDGSGNWSTFASNKL